MKTGFRNSILLAVVGLTLFSFTAAVQSEGYSVLAKKSKVEWTGRKVGGQHVGIVNVKSGSLTLEGELITAGEILIDMTTVKATDTESPKLLKHIRSADFFNVEAYPESKLVITGSKMMGTDTLEVTGTMTILDKTNDVTFTAVNIGKTENFRIYTSKLTVDRTKYGIVYKSSAVGDAYIKDEFDLKIKIAAQKQG